MVNEQKQTAGPVATNSNPGSSKKTGANNTGTIVVDKNKSAEQYIIDAEVKYIVPKLVREKFPDLIKLIFETESMDTDEREYWLQIMPIMTEEQIVKFRDILVNEKKQLEKLDQEYEAEMAKISSKHSTVLDEAKMKKRMAEIKEEEQKKEVQEQSKEEKILEELENL
ncbi:hypothetical protein GF354_05015 [Candidatus Peregrinibacteria bacterium]|nr:hypothetical protein [Candidatus Peregrinibacteria bacterium]